jgi:hypothetical protein
LPERDREGSAPWLCVQCGLGRGADGGQEERVMNTFENNLLEDWSACKTLLSLSDLGEVERRMAALIALMELCQDRAWLAADC